MIVIAAYIKLATKEYPRYEGDIRVDHPEITDDQTGDTFPEVDDYAAVVWVDPPVVQSPQYAYEGPPEDVNGIWRMVWLIGTHTQKELDVLAGWMANLGKPPRAQVLDIAGRPPDAL